MINNMNLGASIASELAPRIDRLVKQADGNRDGCISTSEFSTFLADVLHKLDATATAAPPAPPAASAPPAPVPPAPVAPSTLETAAGAAARGPLSAKF